MVELWYLDTFSKIFAHEGVSRTNAVGAVHKYIRGIFVNYFGTKRLKEKLLSDIEHAVNKALTSWSSHPSVEIKKAASAVSNSTSLLSMIIRLKKNQ